MPFLINPSNHRFFQQSCGCISLVISAKEDEWVLHTIRYCGGSDEGAEFGFNYAPEVFAPGSLRSLWHKITDGRWLTEDEVKDNITKMNKLWADGHRLRQVKAMLGISG